MALLRARRWQNAAARNGPRDASGTMPADTGEIEQVGGPGHHDARSDQPDRVAGRVS